MVTLSLESANDVSGNAHAIADAAIPVEMHRRRRLGRRVRRGRGPRCRPEARAATPDFDERAAVPRSGPVGYTSFIHPTAAVRTPVFRIGAQSLIEGFVTLDGAATQLGHASDLQDNTRLLSYGSVPGFLEIGDGSFTAHNVTFIGKVKIGDAVGTVISAVVQNAVVGDASIVGFTAQILGTNPLAPIRIPPAHLVLFGARIRSQADVAANTIPIPAPFSLFASDVNQENVLLARAYNLLYRAAGRITPFSAIANHPGNPGPNFPNLATAFGKLSVGPPTVDRRGTGVIPARQATLDDLGFQVFPPLSPVPTPSTPAPDKGGVNAPPSDSPEAGARFIAPRVASPDLIDNAILIGGVELAANVRVGPGSYLHGGDAPAISIGANTTIGRNTSVHELTFTSVRIGANVAIGDRVVLHGPLRIGDNVRIGNGTVLFGPSVAPNVKIGRNVLAFGPIAITSDVPDNTILVAPGTEALIAPSHTGPRGTGQKAAEMMRSWREAQATGGGCGCGVGCMTQAFG